MIDKIQYALQLFSAIKPWVDRTRAKGSYWLTSPQKFELMRGLTESLARDVDIDNKTAKAWISVLEASGLIYLLRPWHSNLSKRLIKAPKLYFLDTGLAAYLARWPAPEALEAGALSGAILETWVVSEILKSYWHNGLEPPVHFYRDDDQREIDLLIESAGTLYPVEIKKTANPSLGASRQFGALARLGRPVGPGAVICLAARHVPLSAEVTAVPVSYL
jgi:predicted AAA+ superfamily ATPase